MTLGKVSIITDAFTWASLNLRMTWRLRGAFKARITIQRTNRNVLPDLDPP